MSPIKSSDFAHPTQDWPMLFRTRQWHPAKAWRQPPCGQARIAELFNSAILLVVRRAGLKAGDGRGGRHGYTLSQCSTRQWRPGSAWRQPPNRLARIAELFNSAILVIVRRAGLKAGDGRGVTHGCVIDQCATC